MSVAPLAGNRLRLDESCAVDAVENTLSPSTHLILGFIALTPRDPQAERHTMLKKSWERLEGPERKLQEERDRRARDKIDVSDAERADPCKSLSAALTA